MGVLGKMKLWLLTLAILSGSEAFPGSGFGFLSRVKRSQVDCAAIQTAHGECTSKAYADYQAEWASGDDGRPDWVARKTCNYLTGSIENCGNKLVESGCVSQEEVDRMKDNQMTAPGLVVRAARLRIRSNKGRGVWLPTPSTGGQEPLARPIGSQDPGPPSWMFGTATD